MTKTETDGWGLQLSSIQSHLSRTKGESWVAPNFRCHHALPRPLLSCTFPILDLPGPMAAFGMLPMLCRTELGLILGSACSTSCTALTWSLLYPRKFQYASKTIPLPPNGTFCPDIGWQRKYGAGSSSPSSKTPVNSKDSRT